MTDFVRRGPDNTKAIIIDPDPLVPRITPRFSSIGVIATAAERLQGFR